jgi:tyrosyl-tRNA synthetase
MELKRELARKIVAMYYDEKIALDAESYFNRVTVSKGMPDEIEEYQLKNDDLLVNIIADSGLLKSKSEARRMIKQSAVKMDGETIKDIQYKVSMSDSFVLKVGKRKFLKVVN